MDVATKYMKGAVQDAVKFRMVK